MEWEQCMLKGGVRFRRDPCPCEAMQAPARTPECPALTINTARKAHLSLPAFDFCNEQ